MKVLGFGAVLWDDIKGNEGTHSNSIRGEQNIGGAVFNLIAHAKKLGADSYIVSAVGKDKLGKKTLRKVESLGVSKKFIKKVNAPTCVIPVNFDSREEPTYTIPDFTSWDLIELEDSDMELIREKSFDCLCFGTLEQRNKVSRKTLELILKEGTFENVFLDMNLRKYYNKEILEFSLSKSNILKLNDQELSETCNILEINDKSYQGAMKGLADKFDIDIVSVTLGSNGAYVYSSGGTYYCPGYKVKVSDTVGSGDAFSAGFLMKILMGASPVVACDFGCKLGAFTASRKGSIPEYDIEEINSFKYLDSTSKCNFDLEKRGKPR